MAETQAQCRLHLDRGFEHKLRAVYMDRDVKCPRCRYHLRGVPGPRCPECGLIVSELLRVADTTCWRLQRERARWLGKRMLVIAGVIGLVGACVVAVGMARW